MLCFAYVSHDIVKTRAIKSRVIEGPNARDKIAFPFILSVSPYKASYIRWDCGLLLWSVRRAAEYFKRTLRCFI